MLGTVTEILRLYEASCLIFSGMELIYTSPHSGVKPLLEFLKLDQTVYPKESLVLLDQVTGKASYLLAVYLGIKTIYTPLASLMAIDAARTHNTILHYETSVPFIMNRDKTSLCPLEASVLLVEDPDDALSVLTDTIHRLMEEKEKASIPAY